MEITSSSVEAGAAVVQAIGTLIAIGYAVKIARDQSIRDETARAQAKADVEMSRTARARVVVWRLVAVFKDFAISLDRCAKHSTNSAQLLELFRDPHDIALPMLHIDGDWTDDIYRDFETLPPELATTTAYLLYSVGQYNRTLERQIALLQSDLQRLAAYFRDRHATLRGDMEKANALLLPLMTKDR